MGSYVIASDLGTGSCKTVVIDNNGVVIGSAQAEYQSKYLQPGWVEQHPEDWVQAVGITVREALSKSKICPDDVAAFGIVGVTHNAVLLDIDGEILRPCILYLDTRSQLECSDLYKRWGKEIFSRTLNSISPIWTWPQLLWVKRNQPETWVKVNKILFQKDYVRNRLAPSFVSDTIDVEGSLLFDPIQNVWIKEFIEDLEIDISVFPEVLSPTEIAGHIDQAGSILTGLPEGTPVITGTTDTAAEVFGAGAVKPGHGTIKLASVGRITCVTTQPILHPNSINYRHVLDGLWYPGTSTKYASAAFRWLRDVMWPGETFITMDKAAQNVPAGCNGLIFHPHLQGEWAPYWDHNLRGDFLGLTMRHSRPHLSRAVMEGVSFSLRAAMEYTQKFGLPVDEIVLIGRGSISSLWAQIISNVLNRPIHIPVEKDAAYGAALITGIGAGIFPKESEGIRSLIKFEKERIPNPLAVKKYDELFNIYQEADEVIKLISQSLTVFDEKYAKKLEES
ncbi:MAG: hypothetical protein JEZ06_12340 [Anaerolineaceae bacterium]|nr:hypothetical protein [Anaerolineaceae bacterium]